MRRFALVWTALIFASIHEVASAQISFDAILPERTYDFGSVARGSQLRHRFRIVNSTDQELHIADTRTKCGCTDVKLGARTLPPRTESYVEAVLDTTRFQGYKASGLTMVIDRPVLTEVDLNLNCFIRGDILLNPGQVDFGVVQRGTSPSKVLTLTYAGGRSDWEVQKMNTISSALIAKLEPLGRTPEGYSQYRLTATLDPKTPIGFFKDEIAIATNDPSSPTLPISVAANVQGAVTISPSIIDLGRVKAGSTVKKTVLVRSSKPFKVTAAKATRGVISATLPKAEAKSLQQLAVTFQAPIKPGSCHAILEIETDLAEEPPAKLTTFATIIP